MSEVGEPLIIESGEKTEKILRPGIVHRLDKDTSGAIVVAKNQKAFEDLKEKFQNREVEKKYHAFVYGNLQEEDDTINRPIGRNKNDFRKWSAQRGARGEMREAITNYRVLARGKVDIEPEQVNEDNQAHQVPQVVNFVEAEPKTGRTHQIRVHFKAIHHPIVSDQLYAPNHPQLLGFKRQALHARSISFFSLKKGKVAPKKISVEAPYPADFEHALKEFQKEGSN